MLTSAFFKDIFKQNFNVQKNVFMKYVITISSWILLLYSLSCFNGKGQLLYHNILSSFKQKEKTEYAGRLANFDQNNKRGGCNRRGGWQKHPKLINGEVGWNKRGDWQISKTGLGMLLAKPCSGSKHACIMPVH